jgi:hypothetical protein
VQTGARLSNLCQPPFLLSCLVRVLWAGCFTRYKGRMLACRGPACPRARETVLMAQRVGRWAHAGTPALAPVTLAVRSVALAV